MPAGRPRAFDPDLALEKAMQVFWEKGYEGTTLPDLTQAMGINRPSLYAAFGNKEELFRKALIRYGAGPAACLEKAMALPNARHAVEEMLASAADMQTNPANPAGCLAVQGALACGDEADPIRQELIKSRNDFRVTLQTRLERAQQENDLPQQFDPGELAQYFVTIIQGMAVQAASGATRDDLQRVIDLAMSIWPHANPKSE
jgi:AcrR family transcriptional regulator